MPVVVSPFFNKPLELMRASHTNSSRIEGSRDRTSVHPRAVKSDRKKKTEDVTNQTASLSKLDEVSLFVIVFQSDPKDRL